MIGILFRCLSGGGLLSPVIEDVVLSVMSLLSCFMLGCTENEISGYLYIHIPPDRHTCLI